MTKILFSIFDKVSGTFAAPFMGINRGDAIRNASQLVNSPDNMVSSHPNDYALYEIATFDVQTGHVIDDDLPVFVVNLSELVKEAA